MGADRSPVEAPGRWVSDAACADVGPDVMHADRNTGPDRIAAAKQICAGCPVLDPCRTWALTAPDPATGLVAGGLTQTERAKIRRGR